MNATLLFTAITATARTSISVSAAVPAGALTATVRFVNPSSEYVEAHYGKTGSSEDFVIQLNPGESSADVEIGLTSALTIDYYLSGGSVNVWAIGYSSGVESGQGYTYTSPELVASILRLIVPSTGARLVFSAATDPTLIEVTNRIRESEDFIDQETEHAWRAVTVADEYHDVRGSGFGLYSRELPISLHHRKIRAMVSGTDLIEVWDGSAWVDYVATKTEGRNNDYWVDYTNGVIYFVGSRPYVQNRGVRVTYRYGETTVPKDIQDVCTKLVAIRILQDDDYIKVLPEGVSQYAVASKVESWTKDIEKKLSNYEEVTAGAGA